MKTIRKNTFETNSSSTHSLTIERKGTKAKTALQPLVDDGVMYYERLDTHTKHFGESSILCCDTGDMKAAMLIHWMFEFIENGEDDGIYDEDSGFDLEKWKKDVLELICSKMGYKSISDYDAYDYSAYTEYCDGPDIDWTEVDSIAKFIDEVVLNEDMEITDSDTPN
jgi:hypothetical protein